MSTIMDTERKWNGEIWALADRQILASAAPIANVAAWVENGLAAFGVRRSLAASSHFIRASPIGERHQRQEAAAYD